MALVLFFLTTPEMLGREGIRIAGYQLCSPFSHTFLSFCCRRQTLSHSQTLGKVNFSITYGTGGTGGHPPLLPPFAPPCRLSSSGLGCSAWTVTKILCTVFTRRGVKAGAWLYSNHMGPRPCLHKRAGAKTDDPVAWGPDYKHNPSPEPVACFWVTPHRSSMEAPLYPGRLIC